MVRKEDSYLVERERTARGELVLRQRGDAFEIISNGVFLMDTRDGRSERLLVRAALETARCPATVLIAGLGVGFSLREALADPRVERVTVTEIEPTVIAWHRGHLAEISAGALSDPRVDIIVRDVIDLLREDTRSYDAICLDVDNGPDWTVTPSNAWLYTDAGTAAAVSRLTDDGALSIWGAAPSPAYDAILRRYLEAVRTVTVDVPRGEPDVVWVGRRRGPDPRVDLGIRVV